MKRDISKLREEIINSISEDKDISTIYLSDEKDIPHCLIVGEHLESTVIGFKKFYDKHPKMLDLDINLELTTENELSISRKISRATNDFINKAIKIKEKLKGEPHDTV